MLYLTQQCIIRIICIHKLVSCSRQNPLACACALLQERPTQWNACFFRAQCTGTKTWKVRQARLPGSSRPLSSASVGVDPAVHTRTLIKVHGLAPEAIWLSFFHCEKFENAFKHALTSSRSDLRSYLVRKLTKQVGTVKRLSTSSFLSLSLLPSLPPSLSLSHPLR